MAFRTQMQKCKKRRNKTQILIIYNGLLTLNTYSAILLAFFPSKCNVTILKLNNKYNKLSDVKNVKIEFPQDYLKAKGIL